MFAWSAWQSVDVVDLPNGVATVWTIGEMGVGPIGRATTVDEVIAQFGEVDTLTRAVLEQPEEEGRAARFEGVRLNVSYRVSDRIIVRVVIAPGPIIPVLAGVRLEGDLDEVLEQLWSASVSSFQAPGDPSTWELAPWEYPDIRIVVVGSDADWPQVDGVVVHLSA